MIQLKLLETMLHDVLINIEQMLAPFKRYLDAFEAGMAPQMNNRGIQSNNQMIQAHFMAQTLHVAQPTHANVPAGNAKEPKFIMLEKFDGT
jgi:hypothetical protein